MPNTRLEKAKIIENLKAHLENKQKDSTLITRDFNLVTDEQDRSPLYSDDPKLVDS